MNIEEMQKQLDELPEDESKRIIQFLLYTDIKSMKEKFDAKVKSNFIKPLRLANKRNLKKLYIMDSIPKEAKNLLNQSLTTISNVHYMLKRNFLVDANTLLRSCFENIIMAMMIYFDDNVYREFKILGLEDSKRIFTKLSYLRNNFKKQLKKINPELFNNVSNRMIGNMLQDCYDKLCLYTHSTLIVNEMIEIKLNKDEELFSFAFKINALFIEITLYSCLNYLAGEINSLDYNYIILGMFSIMSTIDKEKCTTEYLKKYNDLLYPAINNGFINKDSEMIKEMQDMSNELKEFINKNPILVASYLSELLEKN